jgi:hypothetical protein
MPQFHLNGTTVELVPQERNVFGWLATQIYRKLFATGVPPLPGLLSIMALDAPRQNVALDDARAQAVMWTLYQLGFDTVTMDTESNQVKWQKGSHTDIGGSPVMGHFTEEGLKDGRALAAALSIVLQRTIRVNGTELTVRTVDIELLKAQAEEMKKRHTNPQTDMSLAAARYVAELISSGASDTDLRLRAALEFAADLGVRSLVIDAANRQVRIEAFADAACLAAAFFQNAPVEQFQTALQRCQTLNAAAEESARKAGVGSGAGGKGASGQAVGAAQSQSVNLAFKRRRR